MDCCQYAMRSTASLDHAKIKLGRSLQHMCTQHLIVAANCSVPETNACMCAVLRALRRINTGRWGTLVYGAMQRPQRAQAWCAQQQQWRHTCLSGEPAMVQLSTPWLQLWRRYKGHWTAGSSSSLTPIALYRSVSCRTSTFAGLSFGACKARRSTMSDEALHSPAIVLISHVMGQMLSGIWGPRSG